MDIPSDREMKQKVKGYWEKRAVWIPYVVGAVLIYWIFIKK